MSGVNTERISTLVDELHPIWLVILNYPMIPNNLNIHIKPIKHEIIGAGVAAYGSYLLLRPKPQFN